MSRMCVVMGSSAKHEANLVMIVRLNRIIIVHRIVVVGYKLSVLIVLCSIRLLLTPVKGVMEG